MSGSEWIAKRDRNDMAAGHASLRDSVPAPAKPSPALRRIRVEDMAGADTTDEYRDGPL